MDKVVEAALKVFFEDDHDIDVDPYEQMTKAITAADEARAVTDEEVVSVIGSAMARYITAYRERGSKPDLRTSDLAQAGLDELRAAGLKVVRG